MSKEEAMKLALEALESYKGFIEDAHIIEGQWHWIDGADNAQAALREALAEQPAQQEPVVEIGKIISNLEPLLAAKNQSWAYAEKMLLELLTAAAQPAQRTWVGLNLSDREKLRDRFEGWGYPAILVDAVSDILKEKNT